MARIEMTEAEVLEAITQATRGGTDDDGLTSAEIADRLGCSRKLALDRLRKLARDGRLQAGWRRDYRLDGVPCKIPVYRVLAA